MISPGSTYASTESLKSTTYRVHLLDIKLEIDSARPGGGHAKLQLGERKSLGTGSVKRSSARRIRNISSLQPGILTPSKSLRTCVFSGSDICVYPYVSIGCVGRDQPNLPRLQAGVCSERFPDLTFRGISCGFLKGGSVGWGGPYGSDEFDGRIGCHFDRSCCLCFVGVWKEVGIGM